MKTLASTIEIIGFTCWVIGVVLSLFLASSENKEFGFHFQDYIFLEGFAFYILLFLGALGIICHKVSEYITNKL
jgi:hypothetical protein